MKTLVILLFSFFVWSHSLLAQNDSINGKTKMYAANLGEAPQKSRLHSMAKSWSRSVVRLRVCLKKSGCIDRIEMHTKNIRIVRYAMRQLNRRIINTVDSSADRRFINQPPVNSSI